MLSAPRWSGITPRRWRTPAPPSWRASRAAGQCRGRIEHGPRRAAGFATPAARRRQGEADAARAGRALPLAPADLALARPDLWATAKAAERFLAARPGVLSLGGFKPLSRARYRKGLRGRWSAALVPADGGRAALGAIVGPVTAYEIEAVDPAAPVPDPSLPARRTRLAALGDRLTAAKPRREWAVREIDWRTTEAAARAAAGLPRAEWQDWRASVRMQQEQVA